MCFTWNWMKFNVVKNKERRLVAGQRSVWWRKRGQPWMHQNGLFPHPFPYYQCGRCLFLLAWGLMAGRHGFTSDKGVTTSVCLCQTWKPLDIPGKHLHIATQLVNQIQPESKEVSLENLCVEIGACLSSGPGENDREHGMGWIWKTVRTSGKLLGQP